MRNTRVAAAAAGIGSRLALGLNGRSGMGRDTRLMIATRRVGSGQGALA